MTAADGDDEDRPAGDESRTGEDSDGSPARDTPTDESWTTTVPGDGETATDDGEATADGGEVAREGGEVTPDRPGTASDAELNMPDSDDSGLSGAPDDEEMPLTEHIEEMLGRMIAVAVVMGGVAIFVFPIADSVINFLWFSFLPGSADQCGQVAAESTDACPRVYHPLGLLFARLKVASLTGLILALPVFVYQTYLFMRPGLYPNERRYYLAAVPTSLLLAFVGVAFAYFLILPLIFEYFLFYSEDVADIAFSLSDTFDLILLMMGLFAFIFQIPLFIMLAIMMGVTTREWLTDKRLLFWFSFGGVAFLFSPDPTGMAPILVALTMIGLFEFTLLLLRWTGR
jgi:sec-independent protein translocase protein TatC